MRCTHLQQWLILKMFCTLNNNAVLVLDFCVPLGHGIGHTRCCQCHLLVQALLCDDILPTTGTFRLILDFLRAIIIAHVIIKTDKLYLPIWNNTSRQFDSTQRKNSKYFTHTWATDCHYMELTPIRCCRY